MGRNPVFIDRAEGAYLYDVDGNRYIDYVGSFGPLIARPCASGDRARQCPGAVASRYQLRRTDCDSRWRWRGRLRAAMPSMEMVRLVNSGTEATMSALRLARAYTGREIIVKVEGGYHGHADGLLAKAGSGPLTLGAPDSPGVPAAAAARTINVPFND